MPEFSPGRGGDGTPIGRGSGFGVNLYVFRPYDLGASMSGKVGFAMAPSSALLGVGVGASFGPWSGGFDVGVDE